MSATERTYSTINGTPLWYLRTSPVLKRVAVSSTREFERKLDSFARSLYYAPPAYYGKLRWVATAGAYVNKPGYHGLGRAFDLDAVKWGSSYSCRPIEQHHRHRRIRIRRRYIAVDALARRHFKYVLDGGYNAAHADHMHFDDGGGAVVFNTGYRSDAVFAQRACNVMIGADLVLDGIYGPLTNRAFARLKRRLDIPHRVSTSPRVYRRFLWRLAIMAFRNRRL